MTDYSDPGFLRHCMRPDCDARFNLGEVYGGLIEAPGWRQVIQVVHGYLCPLHAPAAATGAHLPDWLKWDAEPPGMQGIACACGWTWQPEIPSTQGQHQDSWLAHLVQADPAPKLASAS